jgi:hypothetical protein
MLIYINFSNGHNQSGQDTPSKYPKFMFKFTFEIPYL